MNLLWKFVKPISFTLIGKEVLFSKLDAHLIGHGVLIVIVGSSVSHFTHWTFAISSILERMSQTSIGCESSIDKLILKQVPINHIPFVFHQVHNNQVALVQREMMSLKLIPFPCGWGVGCSPIRSYYILCLVIPLLYLSFYLCYTIGSPDFVLLTHVWCGFKLERAIVYNDIRIPKSYCPGKYCYLLFTSFVWILSAEINKTAHSDKIPELFDWYKSLCICRLLWHRSHWTSFV